MTIINIVKIFIIILLIILCLIKYVEYVPSKIREMKKRKFVYAKLLNLNTEHCSAFFFYKLIPSDYDNMIIKAREKGICLTKEEIDSFYKQLIKM